ncbi:MAG TPA: HD domain-containing phosphohydrolase [Thermotogota bacterium]|nr:HD domain-containing phosphohydrolase [Thermotogota bacterium]HRW91477.1 HD domain-containing phosphohydrolase [Thermotogota bacterium]
MKISWQPIDEIKTGSVCGDDIFDPNSFVLLTHRGNVLNSQTLAFLKRHNVTWIPVGVEEANAPRPDDTLPLSLEKETMAQAEKALAPDLPLALSDEKYHSALNRFQNFAQVLLEKGTVNPAEITNLSNDIVSEVIKTEPGVLNFLTEISGGFIVKHGINVAILAASLAHHLKQPWHYLVQLVKVALLHDVGLIWVSPKRSLQFVEDIQKEFEYGPMDRIKMHPILAVKIIQKVDPGFLEKDVETGILEHHERFDGRGFPFHRVGKGIHFFARVLAVADTYDTLITSIGGKARMDPHAALRWIISKVDSVFDPDMVRAFIQIAGIYPTGTLVKLNDGSMGKVISRGERALGRPILLSEGREIELEKNPDLFILEVKGIG